MGAWWSSLESLLRTQNILLWVGMVSALIVALSGVFGFVVNSRITTLRQSVSQQAASHETESDQQLRVQSEELAQTKQLLDASETRSEGFLDRIESLEEQLESLTQDRDQWKKLAGSRQAPQAAPPSGFLTPDQRTKFLRALENSPPSSLTLITIAGNEASRKLGNQIAQLIRQAGWTAYTQEEEFPDPPPSLTFVVHSREATPESALNLSVAMAVVDLVPFPPKVMLDSNHPRGFLGLIAVP